MISEELKNIYHKHGKLTAEIVVDEARDEKSPLYSHFDWDDESAGEKWRLHQARRMILDVTISESESEHTRPAGKYFIHNGDPEEPAWKGIDVIVSDESLMLNVLRRFEDDAAAYVNRIRNLGEYHRLSKEADKKFNKIQKLLNEIIKEYSKKTEEKEAA